MPPRRRLLLTPRKKPVQARSSELVATILQAAIRVLARDGAAAFTTVRVAETAGVSVGSLYQYFPNKESILFRLQQDEWQATAALLGGILADARRPPAARLRQAFEAFFLTEWEEAPLRRALGAAAPRYQEEQDHARQQAQRRLMLSVVSEAAPHLSRGRRAWAAELFVSLLAGMGAEASERSRSRTDVARWAAGVADMFLGYLGLPVSRHTTARSPGRSSAGSRPRP